MKRMKITDAARIYLNRKNRLSHPDGDFDNAQRWYPSKSEHRDCCDEIRSPSRAYPYSYMTHCRSLEHVAALCGKDPKKLRAAVKKLKGQDEKETAA